MTTTPTMQRPSMTTDSPVDDATYNVLMALASKLEAIDTYKKYASDGKNGDLWRQLAQEDRQHADMLLKELRGALTSNR
jgi:hypothetical protein